MLKTETNTVAMERRVMAFAIKRLHFSGHHRSLSVDFEHGQWWVSCVNCGAQWSVVDVEERGNPDGFGLEQVTDGEEDGCEV